MIKFKALIHKETGTVVNYLDWYKSTRDYLRIGKRKFNPSDILFSDDFEIIYESELTYKELSEIYRSINDKELGKKVYKILQEKEKLIEKYDIEL